ncbi:DUF4097 domain-containing protein [Labilibacter sediminis]|nr:DUF4097 domain-containing protein [Labilibacter sediminis]
MKRFLHLSEVVFLMLLALNVFTSRAQEIAVQKESSFNEVSKIVVNGDFCALKINKSEGGVVEFKGVIKSGENLDAYKLNTNVAEGVLTIDVEKPAQWKSHWGEIVLAVPNQLEIELNTISGKVDVANISEAKLSIQSKSGHVSIQEIEGNVLAVTPAGDIIVDNFKGSLKAKSKTGKVILRNVEGEQNVSTNKGNITVLNLNGNITIDGGGGLQEIENVKGNISTKATSGNIKISLSEGHVACRIFTGDLKIFQTNGTYSLQSSSGNITGTRVKFTGSSSFTSTEGNIKVQMNTKSNLAFVLKSENSYLRAMGKSKKKSLKVGKGDIVITGISTTGSQAYY